jgi:hypothetical protein
MRKLRMLLRATALSVVRALGTTFVDPKTGHRIGKALVISWRGKVHVIGLDWPAKPIFLPQQRLTYWKQELAFTIYPRPDFPRVRSQAEGVTNERDATTSGSN